jgi:hypothetical protein
MWTVVLPKRVIKSVEKMPAAVQVSFNLLIQVLKIHGPTGPYQWMNYGKLKGKEAYHCHLTKNHKWVACWCIEKGALQIEVYYVGSHQGAPY